MDEPVRLQRKRTKGFNLQRASQEANGLPAISVARPSKWGNPFTVGMNHLDPLTDTWITKASAEQCVNLYRRWVCSSESIIRETLSGKNLACWCDLDQPCHADVLLEIANSPPRPTGKD